MKSVLSTSIYERFLNDHIFDSSIKEENEISKCLSELITARTFKSVSDGAKYGEKCVEQIFDYIFDSIGIKEEQITTDVINKINPNSTSFYQIKASLQTLLPSLEGYWLLTYDAGGVNSFLLHIKENEKKITGKRYSVFTDISNDIIGEIYDTDENITIKALWDKDYYEAIFENIYGHKGNWDKNNSYYNQITLYKNTFTGGTIKGETLGTIIYDNGDVEISNSSNYKDRITLKKVKKPSLLQSGHRYLVDELITVRYD